MYVTILIIIVASLLWATGTFLGFIGGVPKAFKKTPSSTLSGQEVQQAQQDSIDETREKHQQYMSDMKQRIADSTNKKF